MNRVDDFKSIVNYKYQLFDPDDPINRRSVKIAKNLPQDKKDFISAMNTEVALAVTEGLVRDRESLKSWMTEIGLEITRITKNQISVKNPNNPESKPIPLKGEFYEQNFRHSEQSAELKREASERYRQEADSRYANCIERYRKLCESKSEYHLERYATRDRTDSKELTRQLESQNNNPANQHRQDGAERERGHEEDARELTDSNTELEKGLADVKRIEPSHSRASEAEKSPFFIEYSPSFNSTYFAYFDHLFRLRQQEQIQRIKNDRATAEHRNSEADRIKTSNRDEQERVFQKVSEYQGGEINDARSTIIADHRRTAEAIERTTASTAESTGTFASAIGDYRAVKDLNGHLGRQTQRSETDYRALSASSAEAIRADYIAKFYQECARDLGATARDTFSRVGADLRDREQRRSDDTAQFAKDDTERDRRSNQAPSKATERENDLSRALSAEISGFNPKNIFTALDRLEQRKEKQRVRDNDRGFEM